MNRFSFFFILGRPFSPFYSWLMTMRATFYKKNIFKQHTLSVPVISVGNLTMGGSGKTPVVMSLALFLKKSGYHPAIISRGYGGKSTRKYDVVTTGTEVLLSPEQAGDEPFMLAKALKGVPVLIGKSRIHPCQYAVNTFLADVILLDDGFQHIAVTRKIDLVLFNATTLAGNSRVFPGGVLREPVSALNRCHAFMLTGITENNRKRTEKFTDLLKNRFPDKPIFLSHLYQQEIISTEKKKTVVDSCKLGKVYGFCAIANPVRFQESIKTTGVNLVKFKSFKDHKKYNQRLMDKLCHDAIFSGANCLLTTEKDFVKISHYRRTVPLYVLKVKLQFDREFEEYILEALR